MYNIKLKIKGCSDVNSLGKFIRSKDIRLVLFAETHGFLNEAPIQKKIIQSINPNFFLYEMLEESKILNARDVKRFLNKNNKEDFSFISTYGDLKTTIRIARKFNLPIIGCDIKNMCCKSKNWRNEKFSQIDAKNLTNKREERQSKIINQYTSKGLVFASLGAYHLRKGSTTIKNLSEKSFIVVSPLFDGKEKFLIPKDQKKLNVSFKIKLVKR